MAAVWNHSQTRGDARLVLLAIADQAKKNGTGAWPSIRTLAGMTHLEDRSVQRIIRKITELGELRVHEGLGPKGTNLYDIVLPGLGSVEAPRRTRRDDRKSPPPGDAPSPVTDDTVSPPLTESHPQGVTESRGDFLSGDCRGPEGVTVGSPDPRSDPKDRTHTDPARAREATSDQAASLAPRRPLTASGVMAGTLPRDHLRCHQPCIGRVCLHESQFEAFVRMWPGTDADEKRRAVETWVSGVHDAWTTGARRDDVPQANSFEFWRARWDERWQAGSSKARELRRATVDRDVGELMPWVHECAELHGFTCQSSSEHAARLKQAVPA